MTKEIGRNGTGERGTFRFNKQTGKWDPYVEPPPADVNFPHIMIDTIPPTLSMTGSDRVYESKSALRREYKEMGFEETGGVLPEPAKPKKLDHEERRADVARAINDVRYGNAPLTELEKEICKREQREFEEYKKRRKAGTKSRKQAA